ncbi:MAG TPA: carbohydrate kinase [Streptosporangiaceae bacterium]|jgi:fructokinase
MTSMFVVIGEALIDVVVRADGGTLGAYPGGSPANVALGLARLGETAELVTRIGRDSYGDQIERHLAANGVRMSDGHRDGSPTSTATAMLGADRGATYRFDLVWDPPDVRIGADTACVHAGSIATFLPPGAATVARMMDAARPHATISYDPNCRPDLQGDPEDARPGVAAMVARADLVRASSDDLAWLYRDRDPVDVARSWLALGPSLVVVTFGPDGARAVTAGAAPHVPAPRVDIADTVGAGDAFTSALLSGASDAGLLGGRLPEIGADTLAGLLERACRAAAITCTRPGADPPRRAEL